MLVKLACRNIRRSFRDYGIYFITLLLGVSVFYAFNSIQSQSILFDIGNSPDVSIFKTMGSVLSMLSIVIACVLGFLVLYANRFLIKRRKHEFGTYLVLGMRPSHVSLIVLVETLIVGIVSLAVGLVIGIALSQGLSFVTAFLFNIPMTQYQFVFSNEACFLTLGCFSIIFFFVALFNTLTVSRYRLIDLLSARSKNERFINKRPWVNFALFVVSLVILATSYWLLIENGLVMLDAPEFAWATALMIVGTFLFFHSFTGFFIIVIKRVRPIYFKNLNTFTLRQIASKINTASLSLGFVCVLLFFSISIFSCGMGMVEAFTGDVEKATKYDATITANFFFQSTTNKTDVENDEETKRIIAEARANGFDIAAYLAGKGVDWDMFSQRTMQVDIFEVPETFYSDFVDVSAYGPSEANTTTIEDSPLQVIGETQYNALREATGEVSIDLGADGYIVNNTFSEWLALAQKLTSLHTGVEVQGITLRPIHSTVFEQPLCASILSSDVARLVVPDAVIESLGDVAPCNSRLNIDYIGDRKEGDAALYGALAAALSPSSKAIQNGSKYERNFWPVSTVFTAEEYTFQAGSIRMLVTYLALYIGFVFLITTAAVLAIQQLSEVSDSVERYRLLSQIGCDSSMLSRSLLVQLLFYFLCPLALAVCHAACAIGVLSASLFNALGVSILGATVMTIMLVLAIYGSYMLVTYFASRGIIAQAIGRRRA